MVHIFIFFVIFYIIFYKVLVLLNKIYIYEK